MMKKEYAGLHAALVTPYTETGEVNYRELKKLVRRLIAEGIDGFYVGGSTAETFLLTESERKGILEAVLGVQQQAPGQPGAAGGVREVSGGHSGGASTSDRS